MPISILLCEAINPAYPEKSVPNIVKIETEIVNKPYKAIIMAINLKINGREFFYLSMLFNNKYNM